MLRLFVSLLSIAVISVSQLSAQCMMIPVSLKDRCDEATVIVEGKVLSKNSYWNTEHNNIYTRHVIEVYKSFKGDVSSKEIILITEGGLVNDMMQMVSSSLPLIAGDYGIFLLKPNYVSLPESHSPAIDQFEAVAAAQGFIRFNPGDGTASDVFNTYTNIPESVYHAIASYTGNTLTVLKNPADTERTRGSVTISGFTPTTITAGTNSILTITGSGFGASRGSNSVAFMDANYASAFSTAYSPEYISWSDTEIKLYVSDFAGTGPIRVIISSVPVVSSSDLKVTYARSNVNLTTGSFQVNFIGKDNSGYKWIYNNQFNADAKLAFERALSTWRCGTLVNWQLDKNNTTPISTKAWDNVNVITFDSSDTLATGVLGQCSSMNKNCGDIWYVSELDIVFSAKTNWNFTTSAPGSNKYDFETVALHELGHGQQLGHVRDTADIMHQSINKGTVKRDLNNHNLTCGDDVMMESTTHTYCSHPKITAISIGICNIGAGSNTGAEEFTAKNNQPDIFPNPSDGTFHLKLNALLQHASCEIYNLIGQQIFNQPVTGETTITLNYPPGIYLVRIKNGAGVSESKLIIK